MTAGTPLALVPLISSLAAASVFGTAPAEPPLRERYEAEDRAHAAIEDRVERLERQLEDANRAYRHDLPSRDRTRFWWTPPQDDLRGTANATGRRMTDLAKNTTAALLGDESNSAPRLRDRAALLGAIGDQVVAHSNDAGTPVEARLRLLHQRFGDAPAKLSRLDGPTLALMAAAAASGGDLRAAATLIDRSARDPIGLDAVELEFLRGCIASGGIDPRRRAENAIRMLDDQIPPADRMLLAAILLQARLDADRPLAAAAGEVRRRLLPETGIEPTIRIALLHGLADLIADQCRDVVELNDLHPLAALSRATDDASTIDAERIRALLTRVADSPVPSIRAEGLLELAVRDADGDDEDAAADRLVEFVETLPSHPRSMDAASLAVRLGSFERLPAIVRRLGAALPDHPGRHDWSIELGDRARRLGDPMLARSIWLAIPPEVEERIEAVMLAARLDFEQKHRAMWAEDLELLEQLDLSKHSSEIRIARDLLRIDLLAGIGRREDAEREALEIIDRSTLPPGQVLTAATVVARALDSTGRSEDALRFALRLSQQHPDLETALVAGILERTVSRVVRYHDAGRRDDARRLASLVLSRSLSDIESLGDSPDVTPAVLVGAAWLLASIERQDDAEMLVAEALEREPDGLEPLFLRAVLRGGRLRDAHVASEEDARLALADLARIASGMSRGSIWWWRAEVERLEILVALNRDLVRVADRIERWRRQFPSLGGAEFARRLRRLEKTIAERVDSSVD